MFKYNIFYIQIIFIIYTFDHIKTIFYLYFFLNYLTSNIFFNCICKITIMIQNHKTEIYRMNYLRLSRIS